MLHQEVTWKWQDQWLDKQHDRLNIPYSRWTTQHLSSQTSSYWMLLQFSLPSTFQREQEEWKWGIAFWNMPNHAERTASIHQSDNADKQQETDVSRDPWGSVTIYSRVQDIEFHTRKETINISWCDVLWCKTDCVLPLRNSSDFASYVADLTFRLRFSD